MHALKKQAKCIFSSGILIFKSYSIVNVQRLILLNILLYNEMLRGIFTGSAGKYIKIFEKDFLLSQRASSKLDLSCALHK